MDPDIYEPTGISIKALVHAWLHQASLSCGSEKAGHSQEHSIGIGVTGSQSKPCIVPRQKMAVASLLT